MDKSSPNASLSSVYQLKQKLDQSREPGTYSQQKLGTSLPPHQDKKDKLSVLATKIKTAQQPSHGNIIGSKACISKRKSQKPFKLTKAL